MPRTARVKATSNIYHVVIKGADNQIIFENADDCNKYLEYLEKYKQELNFYLLAYCLMSNHVHMLIFSPNVPIDKIFRKLNTSYACWFNLKYNRTGYLQQGRYYSEAIENVNSMLAVMRYIHLNPVHAGLEASPGDSYIWSSIYDYFNIPQNNFGLKKGERHPINFSSGKIFSLESSNLFHSDSLTDTEFIVKCFDNFESFINYHNIKVNEYFLDVSNIRLRLPDDVARQIMLRETGLESCSEFSKLTLPQRDKYLRLLRDDGLSARQLNRLTGISRGVIDRVLRCL